MSRYFAVFDPKGEINFRYVFSSEKMCWDEMIHFARQHNSKVTKEQMQSKGYTVHEITITKTNDETL